MDNHTERDVSQELGYEPISVADQTRGKMFPNTRVKKGTRWFYILLLIVSLLSIAFQFAAAIGILFFG